MDYPPPPPQPPAIIRELPNSSDPFRDRFLTRILSEQEFIRASRDQWVGEEFPYVPRDHPDRRYDLSRFGNPRTPKQISANPHFQREVEIIVRDVNFIYGKEPPQNDVVIELVERHGAGVRNAAGVGLPKRGGRNAPEAVQGRAE